MRGVMPQRRQTHEASLCLPLLPTWPECPGYSAGSSGHPEMRKESWKFRARWPERAGQRTGRGWHGERVPQKCRRFPSSLQLSIGQHMYMKEKTTGKEQGNNSQPSHKAENSSQSPQPGLRNLMIHGYWVLSSAGLWLKVCVPTQISMLKSNAQWDGIRRWGFCNPSTSVSQVAGTIAMHLCVQLQIHCQHKCSLVP